MQVQINNNFSFGVEPDNDKARLIVYNGKQEYVCRKERFGALHKFLQQNAGHAFKGRLQLLKDGGSIYIQVKGEIQGMISIADFKKMLSAITPQPV